MTTGAPIKTTSFARLQIGMSRPRNLPDEALAVFFDSTWVNLGDAPKEPQQIVARPLSFKEQSKQFAKPCYVK
jgi:hypothetical protein